MQDTKLPNFPEFTYLQPHHQVQLVEAIKSNHLYSDYNFISLWSWDHQNRLQLCLLNGNLVIRFHDYLDPNDYFYSFFGTNMPDETAITLLELSVKEGKKELKLIPEFAAKSLKQPERFKIEEDRDSFDYIVAIKDMLEMETPAYQSKRWSLSQFLRNHGDKLLVRELDLKNIRDSQHMLELIDNWRAQMKSRNSYNESEIKALKKILSEHHHIQTDNLHIVGLYLGDELKGFSISELLEDGFAMGHYKKTDRTYRGLGVAMEHFTAKNLAAKGVTHMNHQQDLGFEGLRQSKMAHNPIYFMKKYTLSFK